MVRYYKIANLTLRCFFPDTVSFQENMRYSNFLGKAEKADAWVYFCIAPTWQEKGILVYQDKIQRIRIDQGKTMRYRGNFSLGKNRGKALLCQQYQQEKPGKYKVYLSGKEKCLSEKFAFDSMGLEHILADFRRVILHSSFLVYRGDGILFSAPSGTGKSTQADLWEKYLPGTEIVNGDRSILGYEDGTVWAYGLPMCGSSGIAKRINAPVKSIIILRQGKENLLVRINPASAFRFLLSECGVSLWSKEDMEHVIQLLSIVVKNIPVYFFRCKPDKAAVYIVKNTLYRD